MRNHTVHDSTDEMPCQNKRDSGVAQSSRDQPDCANLVELVEVGVELDVVDGNGSSEAATYRSKWSFEYPAPYDEQWDSQQETMAVQTIRPVIHRLFVSTLTRQAKKS